MSRVLVIGDIHEPVCHPGYLTFCRDLRDRYRCNETVFIGDIADWHAISFHSKHPDAPGPKDEHELSAMKIKQWYDNFRTAKVCIGNHDARVVRVAQEAGIPSKFIRTYSETWKTPRWTWDDNFVVDDVYYFHGTGTGGLHPSYNSMLKMLMSVAQGHIHSAAGVKWRANPQRRIFGMDTGCGIDDKAYAFAYGHDQKIRSILGAGVVLDGIPHHEIMPIGPGEKYHRSRFDGTTRLTMNSIIVPKELHESETRILAVDSIVGRSDRVGRVQPRVQPSPARRSDDTAGRASARTAAKPKARR